MGDEGVRASGVRLNDSRPQSIDGRTLACLRTNHSYASSASLQTTYPAGEIMSLLLISPPTLL